ncbi:MAG: hypothetical protein K2W95_15280 [Candidatus Obscuribacterales bacterium]|nr:hypothetical protein [Candidatus Obscuribacterales bacterium]
MELLELWRLFQQWGEHGNSGHLELESDGSGGIRMADPDIDSMRSDLVVSWNTHAEGVIALTEQLTSGCPAASVFYRSCRPRRRNRSPVVPTRTS